MANTLFRRVVNRLQNKPAIVLALIVGGAIVYLAAFTESVSRLSHTVRQPVALQVAFLRTVQSRDSINEFRRRYLSSDSSLLRHELFPLIDVAFRNTSDQAAVVSAVTLTAHRVRYERISMNCSDLAPSAVYHAILDAERSRQELTLTTSLSVAPHGADRLAVSLGTGQIARVEYEISVALQYNDGRKAQLGTTHLTLLPECALGPQIPHVWAVARGA